MSFELSYNGRPEDIYELGFGECRRIRSTRGVHQGDALGLYLFGMPLGTRLAGTPQQFTTAGVDVTALWKMPSLLYRNSPRN